MKKQILYVIILLLTAQCKVNQHKELIDISDSYISSFVKTKNAKAELVNNESILIEMDKPNPLVELYAPEEKWDLSNNTSISFEVNNLGDTQLALDCHIDDHQWCNALLLLSPGERATMSVPVKGYTLPEDHPLAVLYDGMRGLPGGYLWHWVELDAENVKKLELSLVNPKANAKFSISSIMAKGNLNEKSLDELKETAFPFVDKYGQYMHKDWKGKVKSDRDLQVNAEKEKLDIEKHPSAPDINQYGGYTGGEKYEATGHFRAEKINGKWWLIDPEGCLFWSHGITGVGKGAATTRVQGRNHYFAELPEKDSPRYQFARENSEGDINTFNFTGSNLYLKYGENWKNIQQENAHKRLKSWGMNSIGNWSDEATYMLRKTPYTVNVGYGWEKVGGKLKFPNV